MAASSPLQRDRPTQPQSFITFRFDGYLDEVYATLVVRSTTRSFRTSLAPENARLCRADHGRVSQLGIAG